MFKIGALFYIILLAVYYTNDHQPLKHSSQLHRVHPGEYMYLFSFSVRIQRNT